MLPSPCSPEGGCGWAGFNTYNQESRDLLRFSTVLVFFPFLYLTGGYGIAFGEIAVLAVETAALFFICRKSTVFTKPEPSPVSVVASFGIVFVANSASFSACYFPAKYVYTETRKRVIEEWGEDIFEPSVRSA